MTRFESSNVWFILHIYGSDDTFLEWFHQYMGDEISEKYLENEDIFDEMAFIDNWGKGYWRVITSIIRAFETVYDETSMNDKFLENDEYIKENYDEGFYLSYANRFQELKLLYRQLEGDRYIVKPSCCNCHCKIIFL
jgi:hypothetical protein